MACKFCHQVIEVFLNGLCYKWNDLAWVSYTPSSLYLQSLRVLIYCKSGRGCKFLSCLHRCDFSLQCENKTIFFCFGNVLISPGCGRQMQGTCAVSIDVLEMRRGNLPAIAAAYRRHASCLVLEPQILAMKL